jgi:hypothetical protein
VTVLARGRQLLADPERGAGISVMATGLILGAVLFLGLVMDGGAQNAALSRADATAQEAARAGAQAATVTGGAATVGIGRAVSAAQNYLASAGVSGTVSALGKDGITVTVTITEPTRVLALIGINDATVTGSAVARIVYARG